MLNIHHTSKFVAHPLTGADVSIDFEAYKASPKTIQIHSMGLWETDNFSIEDDLELLQQHEQRHLRREDFAFVILSPELNLSWGCVYFLPLLRHHQEAATYGFDVRTAMITFWTRDSLEVPAFSIQIIASLKQWLKESWNFSSYLFRINSNEIDSQQALEENSFQLRFKINRDNSPTLLFYTK